MTASFSPIPPDAAQYDTALNAGIGGVEAKTGVMYSGGNCGSSRPCLGAPEIFGNPGAGGNDTAYVKMSYYSASGTVACFAYLYFESGFWHDTQPVVCPQQAGYNPVLNGSTHVVTQGSCANVRSNPGLGMRIVTCLKDGTIVRIDPDNPRYVDKHIWWSVNGHQGWMAHDFLITPS